MIREMVRDSSALTNLDIETRLSVPVSTNGHAESPLVPLSPWEESQRLTRRHDAIRPGWRRGITRKIVRFTKENPGTAVVVNATLWK